MQLIKEFIWNGNYSEDIVCYDDFLNIIESGIYEDYFDKNSLDRYWGINEKICPNCGNNLKNHGFAKTNMFGFYNPSIICVGSKVKIYKGEKRNPVVQC